MEKIPIIIPVYNLQEMTNTLLNDFLPELDIVDIYIIDNKSDYKPLGFEFHIERPGTNLGWLRGCNLGIKIAADKKTYPGFVILNNDTRLSKNFVRGLVDAAISKPLCNKIGIVGPLYDDVHHYQKNIFSGIRAELYRPYAREWTVPFIDGTCMYILKEVIEKVGLLDEEHFAVVGWGADIDYAIRTRQADFDVICTERSYLNHFLQATKNLVMPNHLQLAGNEAQAGLTKKWGHSWQQNHINISLCGSKENLKYTAFNEEEYLQANPDVAAAVKNGVHPTGYEHYINWGWEEHRVPFARKSFDEEWYLANNPDVREAVEKHIESSGYEHFVKWGRYEFRPHKLYINVNIKFEWHYQGS